MDAIEAMTCASSPGNSQGWDFVVVRDAEQRKRIGELFRAEVKPRIVPVEAGTDGPRRLMSAGAHHLLDTFERVPVLIFVCGAVIYPPASPMELPEGQRIQVTIPLGWPEKKFGRVKRKPLDEVIHWDHF